MSTHDQQKSTQVKRAYHSPVIRHYGAIQAITQAVGNMGLASDGGTMTGMNKTS